MKQSINNRDVTTAYSIGQHYDDLSVTTSVDWRTPLLLSLIAGLSTCIGAAIVFCLDHPSSSSSTVTAKSGRKRGTTTKLGPSHMAFSLTLAGSVMITVSIASILPESFLLDDDIHYTPFGSMDFCQRCIAFGTGCGIYLILSKFVFPAAPDEIISSNFCENDDCESMQTSLTTTALGDRVLNGSEESLVLLLDENESLPDANLFPLILTASAHGLLKSKILLRKNILGSSSFDSYEEPSNNSSVSVNQKSASSWKGKHANSNASYCMYVSKYMRGTDLTDNEARRKWRVTMLLLISLAVHNFPEGLAVAASALHSPRLGVTTTIAIALHNIPEGIAIAIPCLAARPDLPWLAFALASLSGLAEPLGAIVALLFIDQNSGDTDESKNAISMHMVMWNALLNMKNVLSFVAGMMMTVAIVELFPEARRHMKETPIPGILGTVFGAIVMLASDAYLAS